MAVEGFEVTPAPGIWAAFLPRYLPHQGENHARQVQTAEGEKRGPRHESTHLARVTDLRPAGVPAAGLPQVDRATLRALRTAAREQPGATCATVLDGGIPAFAGDRLDGQQQAAFMPHLRRQCERRTKGQ